MSSESELYTELFSTYSNFSIPTNATPLIVTVYLHFLYILAVAETQETIKFLAFFNYYWTDSYLQWNSTRIQNIVVEANEIWRPDVVCTSCAEVTGVLGDKRIEIGSDGNIGYGFPEVMVSRCPLSIHNFPFDTQKCSVTLQVMSYQADQVLLKPGVAFLGDEIRGTTEWDLKNVTAVWMLNSNNKTGYLEIEIVIKRNSTCYVWVLMVPTFLACNLAVVGTFLPTINTGTRFSKVLLNVCVLLTMMVLLDIAAADIPKTSYLPQLAWFIFIEMLVCFLAGVISVLMLVTHHIVTICDATSPAW
ncbi:unnamed protein product, partial [Mesorhabditis belari]|uniref:Neurotransmitter-gated ion-channel ligand-binding domain-containing protein n=1 Tax=Mesorhabditis belari TaxID=2138241 RepID=A0AAF3F147_9BILA